MGKVFSFSRVTGICLLIIIVFIILIREIDSGKRAVPSGEMILFFDNLSNLAGCFLFRTQLAISNLNKAFIASLVFLLFYWCTDKIKTPSDFMYRFFCISVYLVKKVIQFLPRQQIP